MCSDSPDSTVSQECYDWHLSKFKIGIFRFYTQRRSREIRYGWNNLSYLAQSPVIHRSDGAGEQSACNLIDMQHS